MSVDILERPLQSCFGAVLTLERCYRDPLCIYKDPLCVLERSYRDPLCVLERSFTETHFVFWSGGFAPSVQLLVIPHTESPSGENHNKLCHKQKGLTQCFSQVQQMEGPFAVISTGTCHMCLVTHVCVGYLLTYSLSKIERGVWQTVKKSKLINNNKNWTETKHYHFGCIGHIYLEERDPLLAIVNASKEISKSI